MAYGLRAWTAAGPYPGVLGLSPRTEKHTVTTDALRGRVETREVADAARGSSRERIVSDRFGDLRETAIVDAISGRTHTSRVRSESPRGLRRAYFDDLRPHTALADGLYDPLYRGRLGLSRAALDDPLYDPLYRGRVGLSRAALDDPLYDPLYRGRLGAGLYSDPLYADPLYRRSALDSDWRLSSRFGGRYGGLYGGYGYGYGGLYGGYGYGRGAYDDLTLARRSANLDSALVNRELMYDLDNLAWSRTAFRNPLTGTLA